MRPSSILLNLMILCLLYFSSPVQAQSQEDSARVVSAGVDLASKYLWRGTILSPGPVIQPYIETYFLGFTLGAQSSIAFNDFEWQETNLYLGYDWNFLNISLNDYFSFSDTSAPPGYLDYRTNYTYHILELTAAFTGTEKIPFRIMAGYNFFGDDDSKSLYFEGAWMKTLQDGELEISTGYTPHVGYYHETRQGLTHFGVSYTREIYSNNKIAIPLQVCLQYLPMIQQTFLTTTISIY